MVDSREQSFLVEDFVESIAAQLDRVQDTLRLKALNRPLTYALKDFSLDLNVFVTMDAEGNVRFRTSAPNEEGASTVKIGFTTITRPMIEENTVDLSLTRSPTLDELGLEANERRQLHKLGVRNAAQLNRLQKSTGTATVSRFSGISVDRLRNAIQFGQPRIDRIRPERPPQKPTRPASGTAPLIPRHPDSGVNPKVIPPRPTRPDSRLIQPQKPAPRPAPNTKLADARTSPIRTAPGVNRLRLIGKNILGAQGLPVVSLNHLPLEIIESDDDEMVVGLPHTPESGLLQIDVPDGVQMEFDLIMTDATMPGTLNYDYPDEYVLSDDAAYFANINHSPSMSANDEAYYHDLDEDYHDVWTPRNRRNGRHQS